MNLGLNRKARTKANEAPAGSENVVDPAEQVRRRIDKSGDIGSPLLYPF